MKLIYRNTDYAIRALMFIAQHPDTTVPTKQIEQQLGLPRPFLRKILQALQKARVLDSVKGNKGGFILKKNPNKISLADVMTIFQGDLTLCECFLMKDICPRIKTCNIRSKVKAIERTVISELKQITIENLLECE